MKSKLLLKLLGSGGALLLCAGMALAQTSNTVVTFSVDMSFASPFVLGTDQVAVRGSFNGWGQYFLTNNPSASNPYLFSGTTTNTTDVNGTPMAFKFWQSDASAANGGWESPVTGGSGNRLVVLPPTSGASLVLPTMFYSDDGPPTNATITFQVDMTVQLATGAFDTNAGDTVEVQGNFQGWQSGDILMNDPTILRTNGTTVTSNVWVGSFTAIDPESPGQIIWYKFVIQPGGHYESPIQVDGTGNRYGFMAGITNPVVYFSDVAPAPIVTNLVTFQVDMTAQVQGGGFDPATDDIDVAGLFNGWSTSANPMTNNPDAANTNIYSTQVLLVAPVGSTQPFKYVDTRGYESLSPSTPQSGGNRFFLQPNATNTDFYTNTVLPVVYFSDTPPGIQTTITVPTEVTFTVNMTGAAEYGDPTYTFQPSSDSVYLNADFLGWPTWNVIDLASYQLTNNPVGSSNYSLTILIPAGNSLAVTYKYGMYNVAAGNENSLDDEAGFAQNHYRYIRTQGNYTMPLDTFGNQFDEPTAFGQLVAGAPAHGQVPISWLGLPGVQLQSSTNLAGNHWVSHPETDGASFTNGYISNNGFISVTNWPAASSTLYFRLIRPTH